MLLKRFLSLGISVNKSAPPQHFKLLQSFSIVSLSAFIVATGVLAAFYRQREVQDLVMASEENNVALTRVFFNTLWPKYGSYLSSTQSLSNEELQTSPVILQLREDVLAQFEELPVVKVKVFDLEGRTVFSTDLSQIGEDRSQTSGYQAAKSGQVISQLGHRDTFQALQSNLTNRYLLSSYIPICSRGTEEQVIGVFELYTDVTPLLQRIDTAQREIILWSLLVLATLYSVLYFFVRRADVLIRKQYQQLQESEGRYRQQASELRQVLAKLQKTQAQMIQGEKMSSLGQLVAGVAHEINNPVTFIYSNLHHVQGYSRDLLNLLRLYQYYYPNPAGEIQTEAQKIDLDFIQDDLPKTLASMELGSDRIREIILSLRNFSRLDQAEIKPVNIHQGLDDTLMILTHRLKAHADRPGIQVTKDYAPLPPIECYAGLMNQVFMNILSNAIDALEADMSQRTYQECLDNPSYIKLQTARLDEKWIQIVISDNASGIVPEIQNRIFEPFFTTKPVGKGTGMGMSISYQIVTERHGGNLACFSTPDEGTQFIIQIPSKPKV